MRSLTPRNRYGLPSLALHWFMALLLVALVICVELHELFPKGDPIRAGLVAWHFRLGLAVFVLVWLRLVLRWVDRTPAITPTPPRWQTGLSHAVQGLLYLLMIASKVVRGHYEPSGNYQVVEIAGLYWHFVDLVWVFIFALFYLW